jgi:hypothetical protein
MFTLPHRVIAGVGCLLALLAGATASSLSAQVKLEGRVTTARANVRLQPDRSAPIIDKLPADTVVEVIDLGGQWVKIALPKTDGVRRTGFVHRDLIDVHTVGVDADIDAQASEKAPSSPTPTASPLPDPVETSISNAPAPAAEDASAADNVESAEKILHASIHPGQAANPAYWRAVVKVLRVLEQRHRQKYNLVSPVLVNELNAVEAEVPRRTDDKEEDVVGFRQLAVECLARIDPKGAIINWQQTLSGVQPEKRRLAGVLSRGARVAVYAVNPLGAAAAVVK